MLSIFGLKNCHQGSCRILDRQIERGLCLAPVSILTRHNSGYNSNAGPVSDGVRKRCGPPSQHCRVLSGNAGGLAPFYFTVQPWKFSFRIIRTLFVSRSIATAIWRESLDINSTNVLVRTTHGFPGYSPDHDWNSDPRPFTRYQINASRAASGEKIVYTEWVALLPDNIQRAGVCAVDLGLAKSNRIGD